MITFRSMDDIPKARLPPHLIKPVTERMQQILSAYQNYTPDDDGYLAVITPSDTDGQLTLKLGYRWRDNLFEGCRYINESRCYLVTMLRNNQFCISIMIPDEPWLDPAISKRLKDAGA